MKKIVIFLTSICLMNYCATIFCGYKQKITLNANIEQKAEMTIDGHSYNVNFPYTVKIPRGFDATVIKASSEGYHPVTLIIDKNFNAVSVLNLCDILGWDIDAATEAMMDPEFKYYDLRFIKKSEDSDNGKAETDK